MQDKVFADSNIWLYAFMESEAPKKQIASNIILNADICLSVQVVNEICVNLIKKANFLNNDILVLINNLKKIYTISNLDFFIVKQGAEIRLKYEISFWDSLIVASALQNNCNILYTEDMQHNQIIENSLTIINPFI
jgi:predicted nucleic acid-binding protein